MRAPLVSIVICTLVLFLCPRFSHASTPAYTLIINQIRGAECCDPGSAAVTSQYSAALQDLGLPATFAVRYDALISAQHVQLLTHLPASIEIGAFLEITPSLCKAAGVEYTGNSGNWYQAAHAYLVGYSVEDRKKIIDTYMTKFHDIFGSYPTSSVAWMIDTWSLRYLQEKYGIKIHEITREQMHTDSYTLYGGPPHYPYRPSTKWLFVPSEKNEKMPLITRQTITDPVMNYGDSTNAYTSQPNDYQHKNFSIDYFSHLFLQAHAQTGNSYTFALIGLENSMPAVARNEYFKQLTFVKKWQSESPDHNVLTAKSFTDMESIDPVSIYAGTDYSDKNEKAWWITTRYYRVRLRQSKGELFIDDIRLYDQNFTDPYETQKAEKDGFWIVPFVLDGSRYFNGDTSLRAQTLAADGYLKRLPEEYDPTRIQLMEHQENQILIAKKNGEILLTSKGEKIPFARFSETSFSLQKNLKLFMQNEFLSLALKNFSWRNHGTIIWELQSSRKGDYLVFTPHVDKPELLAQERIERYPFLFPEIKDRPLDVKKTTLILSNVYAVAGRNPARIVFVPHDSFGYPIELTHNPEVKADDNKVAVSLSRQNGNNGMLFIDTTSQHVISSNIHVSYLNFEQNVRVYFAPNCKNQLSYCAKHPQQALWYIRSFIGDKVREMEKK